MCLSFPSLMSTRDLITLPSVERDLLMPQASLSVWPTASLCFCLSDPARSTR